ncbi:MAG: zinc finger MYND domain-containing protein [Nitrososphaeraceae archaeon]|nr:zinc finger MYND domain-containing protein [Nitrososphaeraceae archaeon]
MPNQLIIIKPTKFEFKKELYYKNQERLTKDLCDHVIVKGFKQDEMMELIIDEIGLTPELVGDTQTCYETIQYVYQLCFVGYDNSSSIKEEKELNTIATYLNGDSVYGPAVLLNSKICNDYICSPSTVTIENLSHIIYSKFIHKGIIIPNNEKDSVEEYEYCGHPLERLESEENYVKYKLFETTFLGFQLGFFGEINSTKINKRATRLIGNQKLYGNVVMLCKLPHEFQDIDLDLYEKISKLSYGSLKQRELLNTEDREGEKINNLPIALNRFCILDNRYTNYKKICDYCNKELESDKFICSGCYRVRYHNKECQKDDWEKHIIDCLYNKKI